MLIDLRNHFVITKAIAKSSNRVGAHPYLDEILQGLDVAQLFERFFGHLVGLMLSLAFVILIGFEELKSIFLDSKGIVKIAFDTERFQLYQFNLKSRAIYFIACESN